MDTAQRAAASVARIGDVTSEFAELCNRLQQRLASPIEYWDAGGRRVDDESELPRRPPDLVIVLQSRPQQFAPRDVAAWLAHWPLARWIVCEGLWCESDGRNGSCWPAALRVPAREAPTRIALELKVVDNTLPPLPWTASRDECFEFQLARLPDLPAPPGSGRSPHIAVRSPDRAYGRFLEDACRQAGCKLDRVAPEVIFWDLDPWTKSQQESLRACRASLSKSAPPPSQESPDARPPRPTVVGITSWETPQLRREARSAGVARLCSRLAGLPELLQTLSTFR